MSRLFPPPFLASLLLAAVIGCHEPEPIVVYTVPTAIPEQLQPGKDRMLAAMVPKDSDVWFFKITGPEESVSSIEAGFREFVEGIQFSDGVPVLKDLPEGWRRAGEKAMRYASIDIQTSGNQLDLSISKLSRQEDWDAFVKMNVNRWRGQLGLDPSEEKWAEGTALKVATADGEGIWVDLLGESSASTPAMTPPFAGLASGSNTEMPSGASLANQAAAVGEASEAAEAPMGPDPRLKFERPEGWRDGRMSSMRMAAFDVGSADAPAELTIIPAGGDLRGNVARWLGQVMGGTAPDELVDQALQDGQKVEVDGREGQRFLLMDKNATEGTAIDATIVPIDGGMNLFVKMTGPAKTVMEQSDAIASFLRSLKLDL
jgi:hypothetical protein